MSKINKHKEIKMRKNKKNNRFNMKIILLLLAFLIIGVTIGATIFINSYVIETRTVNVDLLVTDRLIMNLDNDSLHLGGTFPGGGSSRGIDIISSEDAFVKVSARGNLSRWLSLNNSTFFVQKGETKSIMVNAYVPKNASLGTYSAVMKIRFYNPKYFSIRQNITETNTTDK